jgi:Fic family protein
MLLICQEKMLNAPILYLSLYLKQHRSQYYDLLQEVRTKGVWEDWLEFFLDGIYKSARQALTTIDQINSLFNRNLAQIETLGRAKFSCIETLDYLKKLPQVSVQLLSSELHMTAPTARAALNALVKLGIVKEMSGKQRNKIYVYHTYLSILEEGADPL